VETNEVDAHAVSIKAAEQHSTRMSRDISVSDDLSTQRAGGTIDPFER
jgi:hypothetical protein